MIISNRIYLAIYDSINSKVTLLFSTPTEIAVTGSELGNITTYEPINCISLGVLSKPEKLEYLKSMLDTYVDVLSFEDTTEQPVKIWRKDGGVSYALIYEFGNGPKSGLVLSHNFILFAENYHANNKTQVYHRTVPYASRHILIGTVKHYFKEYGRKSKRAFTAKRACFDGICVDLGGYNPRREEIHFLNYYCEQLELHEIGNLKVTFIISYEDLADFLILVLSNKKTFAIESLTVYCTWEEYRAIECLPKYLKTLGIGYLNVYFRYEKTEELHSYMRAELDALFNKEIRFIGSYLLRQVGFNFIEKSVMLKKVDEKDFSSYHFQGTSDTTYCILVPKNKLYQPAYSIKGNKQYHCEIIFKAYADMSMAYTKDFIIPAHSKKVMPVEVKYSFYIITKKIMPTQ